MDKEYLCQLLYREQFCCLHSLLWIRIGIGRHSCLCIFCTDMLWFWILCYLIESGCLSGQWKIYETFQATTKIQLHDEEYPRALLAIYSSQSEAHNFLRSDLWRRFEYFKIAKLVHSTQFKSSPVTRIQIWETETNKIGHILQQRDTHSQSNSTLLPFLKMC